MTNTAPPLSADEDDGPAWFEAAMGNMPEESRLLVAGSEIEVLTWGERGKPGLLFLHGNGAHAGWWRFIAPFFAADYRVAAFSWSGMGGSAHRAVYTMDDYVAETMGVASATGLFDAPVAPRIVGHSFGGYVMMAAVSASDRFGSAVILDTPFRPADEPRTAGPPRANEANRPHLVFPTLDQALSRFRLMPSQPTLNPFIFDRVARESLVAVESGWTWKFDALLWGRSSFGATFDILPEAHCPIALIWGDRSVLMPPMRVARMRADLPTGSPAMAIPYCAHHVMLDRPLALVSALRGLFAAWPRDSAVDPSSANACG